MINFSNKKENDFILRAIEVNHKFDKFSDLKTPYTIFNPNYNEYYMIIESNIDGNELFRAITKFISNAKRSSFDIDVKTFLELTNINEHEKIIQIMVMSTIYANSTPWTLNSQLNKKEIDHNLIIPEEYINLANEYKVVANDRNFARKLQDMPSNLINPAGFEEMIVNHLKKLNNVKLMIVGGASFDLKIKSDFEREVYFETKKNPNIIFTGFVPYSEIVNYYSIADLVVLPSIWNEPAGLTMLEAISTSTPLITTNSGGIPEYVEKYGAIILDKDVNLIDNIKINIEYIIEKEVKLDPKLIEECRKKFDLPMYLKKFVTLLENGEDIVTTLIFRKDPPFQPCIFKSQKELPNRQIALEYYDVDEQDLSKPFYVESCGLGCAMIRTEILKNIPQPWFMPRPYTGEDISFMWEARQKGYKILCDPTIEIGHYGIKNFTREDYMKSIEEENRLLNGSVTPEVYLWKE